MPANPHSGSVKPSRDQLCGATCRIAWPYLWCSVLPLLAARTVEAEPNISATATMIRSLLDIVILLEKSVDAMKTRRCRRLFLSRGEPDAQSRFSEALVMSTSPTLAQIV